MQDVEEEQTVPVIVRDWKPVLITDYGVRYHYSLSCPTLAATRRWNAFDRCRRCAGVGGGTPGSRGDDLHRGRLELRGRTGSAGASLTDCTWEECET